MPLGPGDAALKGMSRQGNLQLHYYIREHYPNGLDVQVVQALVEAFPDSVHEHDNNDQLPLHVACLYSSDCGLPVIQFLVESDRATISTRDSQGQMPLHVACAMNEWGDLPSLPIVQFLYDAYPQAAREVQKEGYTPLRLLCEGTKSLPVASFLVQACPESVAIVDSSGRTPLHLLCEDTDYIGSDIGNREGNLELIKLIVQECPEALEAKDKRHRTPLHVAVERLEPSVNCVRWLAERCCSILEANNNQGSGTPLHVFCGDIAADYDNETILECLEALAISEKAVTSTDRKGRTPFHVLCSNGASREYLEILLKKYAGLAEMRDNKGRIPLHLAVEAAADPRRDEEFFHKTISSLLDIFPEAVQVADSDGKTPLEVACENDVSLSLIYLMVSSDPIVSLGLAGGRDVAASPRKRKSCN